MSKVVVQEFVTLDGMAAGPGGDVGFIPASTAGDRSFGEGQSRLMDEVGTIVLGRLTYQMFAGYWPHVKAGDEKAFADKVNAIPKRVVSRTIERAPWGTWDEATVVRNGVADAIGRLKRGPGKDVLVWGSLTLIQHLMSEGLVDEYRLVLCPVALGAGRRLFPEGQALRLQLAGALALDRGAVSLTYRVTR